MRDGLGDQGLDGRKGGAGKGDVDFDAGPDASVDAVEGGVGGDGDFVEGFETDDGGDADAGTVSGLGLEEGYVVWAGRRGRGGKGGTYKAPNPKTNMSPIFCLFGSWSALSRGIGMAKMAMSVAMLTPALANQNCSLFMQWPLMDSSQKAATGTHMTMEPTIVHRP